MTHSKTELVGLPEAAGAPHAMELRHLRYFAAVADAGSFTHAAEQMFIAQPTLSQQIRRLEQIVGTPLLQRRREGLRLTPAGTVLLDASHAVLAATGLDVHLHDLRHTGNQLTADAGANLRELMERMGHSSSRAALIYLHSTSDRQRQLAETVAARVQSELGKPDRTETNRVARVWHDSESTDGKTP